MADPTNNGTDGTNNATEPFADIMAIQRRNFEALAAAQTELVSGMTDLFARCQTEMFRAVLSGAAAIPWADPPKDAAAAIGLVFDTLKNATLDSTARSNALSETIALASGGASTTLNNRWLASLDEWKAAWIAASGPTTAP